MAEKEPSESTLPVEGTFRIHEGAAVTIVRIANMPSLYINNAGLAVSSVDVRLFVGDQLPNPDGSGVTATQRLCLIMTPEYAKAVAENLLRAMESFETQFGKVRDVTARKQADQETPKT